MELGLDMSLLWNRMTFKRTVAELGGSVTDDRDGILSFDLGGKCFFMEAGPSPVFRIGARYAVLPEESAAFMGAAVRLALSGSAVSVQMDPRSATVSFSHFGFAYGEKDLAETLSALTQRIDNAASVLVGLARNY